MWELGGVLFLIGGVLMLAGVVAFFCEEEHLLVLTVIGVVLICVGGAIRDAKYRSTPVGKEQIRNTELKRQIEDRLENQEAYKNRKIYLKKLKEENKKLEDSLKRL